MSFAKARTPKFPLNSHLSDVGLDSVLENQLQLAIQKGHTQSREPLETRSK